MGQETSKPLINNISLPITHLYFPWLQNHRLPGHPQLLRLNNPSVSKQKQLFQQELDPIIERYSLELTISQQEAIRWQRIYAQRKHSLPWHVKVFGYELIKDQCHCANSKYQATVYTEHLEARLCDFQVQRKQTSEGYNQIYLLNSFDISQGIYVLINLLHGYQLLMEQFMVNYPTAYSIGINRKGQVKVWLCDNLALNQQYHRNIPQHLLIEELIQLVDQRTHGSLASIANPQLNYINWSFDKLQELLSEHTIHFNQGRKSLIKRINQNLIRERIKQSIIKKFPLKKQASRELNLPLKQPIISQTTDRGSPPQFLSTERRTQSTEPYKSRNQITFTHAATRRSVETARTTNYESPVKNVRFVYEQPHKAQSQRMTASTYSRSFIPSPVRAPSFQSNKNHPAQPKVFSFPIFNKVPTQKSLYHSHRSSQNALEEAMINKINGDIRISNELQKGNTFNFSLGKEAFIINTVERVQSAKTIERTPPSSKKMIREKQVMPYDFSQPEITSRVAISDVPSSEKDVLGLTQQFRALLKSDKKQEPEEVIFNRGIATSYDMVDLTLDHSSQGEINSFSKLNLNQNSGDLLPSYMQINFESIKEVDEERSFSVDDHV